MQYPAELLPRSTYKSIDCDLQSFLLARLITSPDVKSIEDIVDPQTGFVLIKHICSPKERIVDLSTSLLGIYKSEHTSLKFTEVGKKYLEYCEPDTDVEPPVFEVDFWDKGQIYFWWIQIGNIQNKEFFYNSGDETVTVTCKIVHTPTLCNFWHFSCRWDTPFGFLKEVVSKRDGKIAQKIAHVARNEISQTAALVFETDIPILPQSCYCK